MLLVASLFQRSKGQNLDIRLPQAVVYTILIQINASAFQPLAIFIYINIKVNTCCISVNNSTRALASSFKAREHLLAIFNIIPAKCIKNAFSMTSFTVMYDQWMIGEEWSSHTIPVFTFSNQTFILTHNAASELKRLKRHFSITPCQTHLLVKKTQSRWM